MGTNTNIEWVDHTWNPWRGCTKVNAECKYCYMFREQERYGRDPSVVVKAAPATFNAILNKSKYLPGNSVFVDSWSDFFHVDADPWRAEAYELMRQRPDLVYVIVTKRIERAEACWPDDWGPDGWPNVVVCVSAGRQKSAEEFIPQLIKTRARVRGVSIEPLLEFMNLARWMSGLDITMNEDGSEANHASGGSDLDWVIVGGESGPKARPMSATWARYLRDQCAESYTPFFFKQHGEWLSGSQMTHEEREHLADTLSLDDVHIFDVNDPDTHNMAARIGKKKAGHLLDGVEHFNWPPVFHEYKQKYGAADAKESSRA